jgi:hypothetical protein
VAVQIEGTTIVERFGVQIEVVNLEDLALTRSVPCSRSGPIHDI